MSNLLINEPSLKLLSSLALKIGQSPALALLLQKIHYEKSMLNEEGYSVTFPKLHRKIPFISQRQLERTIVALEEQGLIVSTKYKNQNLGSFYTINYKKLSAWGFECIENGSIKNLINGEKALLILPTLAKKYGIAASGIIQQLYFHIKIHEKESMWLTYSEINKWVPFICISQLREIFYKFEKDNLILSNLSDIPNDRLGKFYSVNHQEIKMKFEKPIANLSVDNNVPIINNIIDKSVDKPIPTTNYPVDKKSQPDHFRHPSPDISGTQAPTFPAPNSIDQRSKKIFKENNNKIMGRKSDCGTIPTMKDNVVSLKERLMTFKIYPVNADRLLTRFSTERIEEVLTAALRQEKIDGRPVFGKWIVNALEENWNLKKTVKKEPKVIIHTKPEDSLYRRELEENTRIALEAMAAVKLAAEEVQKYCIGLIKGTLRVAESRPETNREFAKRIAPNVLEIYSRSEA